MKEIAHGDTIVAETGDRVLVPGVITDGVALVRFAHSQTSLHPTQNNPEQEQMLVSKGRLVDAGTIILVGHIQILVTLR